MCKAFHLHLRSTPQRRVLGYTWEFSKNPVQFLACGAVQKNYRGEFVRISANADSATPGGAAKRQSDSAQCDNRNKQEQAYF